MIQRKRTSHSFWWCKFSNKAATFARCTVGASLIASVSYLKETLRLWFHKYFKKLENMSMTTTKKSRRAPCPGYTLSSFAVTLNLVRSPNESDERTNMAVNNIKYRKQGYFSDRSVLCCGMGCCQMNW